MPLLDTYLAQQEALKKQKKAVTPAIQPATAPAVTPPNLAQLNRVDAGPVAPPPASSAPAQNLAQINKVTAPPPATGGTRADVEASVRKKKPKTLAEYQVSEQSAEALNRAVQQAIQSLTPPPVAQTPMPPVTIPGQYYEGVTPPPPQVGEATPPGGQVSVLEGLKSLISLPMPPIGVTTDYGQQKLSTGSILPPPLETPMPPVTFTREGIAGAGAGANMPGIELAGVTGIPGGSGGSNIGVGRGTQAGVAGLTGQTQQGGFTPGMGQPQQPGYATQQPAQPVVPPFDIGEYRETVSQLFQDLYAQNAALADQMRKQWMADMSSLENQIMQMFQAQGSEIDPATKAALAELRSELDRRIALMKEDLNRRGILQSGLAIKDELRMLSGGMSQEEKLMASRLADLQNRAMDAMMQFAQARLNQMSTMAQNQMQMGQYWAGQRLALEQDIASREDQWTRWWEEQKAQARREAEQNRQWQEEQMLRQAGVTGMYGGQPTFAAQTEAERQRQWQEEQMLRQAGVTGMYQGQPTLEARTSAQKASQPNSATSKFIGQITTYDSREEALADLERYRTVMEAEGADISAIYNAILHHFGGR